MRAGGAAVSIRWERKGEMSLQVWLPLRGDLTQQGLSNSATSGSQTWNTTYNKLGKGSYTCSSITSFDFTELSGATNFSIAYWLYIDSSTTDYSNYADFWQVQMTSGSTTSVARDEFRAAGSTYDGVHAVHMVKDASVGSNTNTYYGFGNRTTAKDRWCHIVLTKDDSYCDVYEDGVRYTHRTNSNFESSLTYLTGKIWLGSSGCKGAYLQDFRIYDHALSQMEIKQLSQGLVLHYPLNRGGWGQENLLRGTPMSASDRTSSFVSNSSTDWTKYFRYYNGSTSIHTFSNDIDTILLNSAANLGVCFQRKATDINLDSSSYYTLSCEAKCTKSGAGLDIGLSYYNTSNTWIWRGGSNRKLFNNTTDWQKFTLTFKPDADTQYIDYCFTVYGAANGTDTFSIRHCKLEKGSVATPWCPNSSDTLATTMGLNSTTEYDCSGFCNNGIRTGTFTWTSDTPKYECSTKFVSGSRISFDSQILTNNANATLAAWVNLSSYTSNRCCICIWNGVYLTVDADGYLSGYAYGKSSAGYHKSSAKVPLNTWTHIACIWDNAGLNLYINGMLDRTIACTGNFNSTSICYIGQEGSNRPTNGSISDLRVYATALSADDVKSLYQNSAYIDSSGNVYGAVHSEV